MSHEPNFRHISPFSLPEECVSLLVENSQKMKGKRLYPASSDDPRIMKTCCCCLDVRLGTIVLGFLHLMIHIAGVVLLTQMLLHPELYEEHYYETYGTTPGSADNSVALAITFCSFIITLLLIYGCITRQPSYLLPFFCLQVFDFCVNLLGAVSAISYIPELKMMLRNKANDMQLYVDKVDSMDLRSLMMTVIIVSMIILFIKGYLIACVWSCYKMLVNHRIEQTTQIFYHPDGQDFEAQNLLPNYEDAVKDVPAGSPPPYTNQ